MFTIGILTVSDKGSQGKREDTGSEAVRDVISQIDARIMDYALVPDEKSLISAQLITWADSGKIDVVITTGGTGLSPRDVTPEATLDVLDKTAPGFAEAMRADSRDKTPHAMLSRGVSGVRNRTLIINLPGSPRAIKECLQVILPALPHAVETTRGEAVECARPETRNSTG